MIFRIWSASNYIDALEPLVEKWHLKKTQWKKEKNEYGKWEETPYSKETNNCFEYFIEINSIEELMTLQQDLYLERGTSWNNEVILKNFDIYKDDKIIAHDCVGLMVYNEYIE